MPVTLLAPAKLNLYLRILGRRPDGYHELETLFERLTLADELTFLQHPADLRLTCDDPSLDCGPDNLVLKAARLLQSLSGRGALIHLAKRIPVASGLGGGSSDAAATLIGLNTLWELDLKYESLLEFAGQLGSDVAFFLCRSAFAIGRGRGQRCEELGGRLPTLHHVVVVPPERLSTRDIYAQWASRAGGLTGRKPSITIPLHALHNGSVDELAAGLWNDLAEAAIRRCPSMQAVQVALHDSGSVGTLVSGSGSAVFGLYRSSAHAQQAAAFIQGRCPAAWQVVVASTHTQ